MTKSGTAGSDDIKHNFTSHQLDDRRIELWTDGRQYDSISPVAISLALFDRKTGLPIPEKVAFSVWIQLYDEQFFLVRQNHFDVEGRRRRGNVGFFAQIEDALATDFRKPGTAPIEEGNYHVWVRLKTSLGDVFDIKGLEITVRDNIMLPR